MSNKKKKKKHKQLTPQELLNRTKIGTMIVTGGDIRWKK